MSCNDLLDHLVGCHLHDQRDSDAERILAATNKCLAQSNKSRTGDEPKLRRRIVDLVEEIAGEDD
jgi:hypothetical protein